MTHAEEELQALHDERLRLLSANGLLETEEKYWRKRAEVVAYTIASVIDERATNVAKGQLTICHETADEARRTLESFAAQAKRGDEGEISVRRVSSV